jgi:hypothetical protein
MFEHLMLKQKTGEEKERLRACGHDLKMMLNVRK